MVSAAISAGGAARRLLVRSQLRLVVQIAKSMLYSPNVELDDLVTVRRLGSGSAGHARSLQLLRGTAL